MVLAGCKERVASAVQRAGGGAEEEFPAGVGKRGAAGEDAGTGSGQAGLTGGGGENQRGETPPSVKTVFPVMELHWMEQLPVQLYWECVFSSDMSGNIEKQYLSEF